MTKKGTHASQTDSLIWTMSKSVANTMDAK